VNPVPASPPPVSAAPTSPARPTASAKPTPHYPSPSPAIEAVETDFDDEHEAPAQPARRDPEPDRGRGIQEAMTEYSRDEILRRIRAKQSLKRGDLSGIQLSGADLEGIDFGRADLDGANLDNAKLRGANLRHANLSNASLKGADLSDADLGKAELDGADMTRAILHRTVLHHASLEGVCLREADLRFVDARHADFLGADFEGAQLGQARLAGVTLSSTNVAMVTFDWIDVSEEGDGTRRLENDKARAFLAGEPAVESNTRYFGRGDVLRDASLEFGPDSRIQIDSRFENCSISLSDGAELTIGDPGVLRDCQIVGNGRIIVHGRFFERASPGIRGARSIVVSARGGLSSGVEQSQEATVFAFEPGCQLRLKILRPTTKAAAE
jgi:hypothetical protein